LISLGYSNYWKDLNAKEIGYPEPVAQNRERCFMVSLLGDYGYKFPQPLKLKKTMADYLEDEVDEKYYLKGEKVEKLISELISSGELETLKKKS
jgi:DNA (cytosine-5)-methyltransferase 1